ncbi:unnamed protein product [Diatraea saccharalis]|uniref:Nucleotide exchange factor Fes1 domain-containing protein n=1 Tax=Diatraea saccharalis TaxID=40085 RepID=A0A9N9R6P4_9NEOP|nr:unnamed protein product [Diatraea saccharalis]
MGSNPENNSSNNPPIAGAITYPTCHGQNLQATPVQPRQPRNLQGLLRFAMEATKAEDAPGNSELGPMDEERRKFLEEALKSLTVDVAEVIQNAIKVLTDQEKIRNIQLGDVLPQDVATSFNNLMEFIDDIDVANDFYKLGGFAIFPVCYGSENEEVRANASWVLAEVCQNNPFCQSRVLECGLLNVLINLLETEQGTALAKCLYAVSCACREYSPCCRELVSQGGCGALSAVLASQDTFPQARTKAAFLIRYLVQHYPDAREEFIQQNLVRIVANQIKTGRDETTEHLLGILTLLLDTNDCRILDQLRDPSLGLKKVLEELSDHEDGREYCVDLLKRVFEDCPEYEVINDEVER